MPPITIANDPFNDRYKVIEKIGEGSYSDVLKCKKRDSGDVYACKRLKKNYSGWSEVNELSEIKSLRQLARHPNILQMTEVHFDPSAGRVHLVFELMDKNLYELIKDRKRLLSEARVRVMMFQLLRALRHLHKHGVFHRDVKPENILVRVTQQTDLLKLGDLGSVRGIYSKAPYTEYISTRWYRSPECLLTCGHYGFKMDIWAAGCVFYETLTLRPLFPGSSELDQINRIHNVLGPPPQRILQKFCNHAEEEKVYAKSTSKKSRFEAINTLLNTFNNSKSRNFDWYFAANKDPTGIDRLLPAHISIDARDMLRSLLQYDPDNRPSSHRVIQHQYFNDLRDKAMVLQKESCIDDSAKPIVTIVGDPRATAMAVADLGNVDLGKLGDHRLKHKMRRLEEAKKAETKVQNPPVPVALATTTKRSVAGLNTVTIANVTVVPAKREEIKSNIPKTIPAVPEEVQVQKIKKQIVPQQFLAKEGNQQPLSEKRNNFNFKYKYPPVENLHVESKGRDGDVDTPFTPMTSIMNRKRNPKPSIQEPKLKKTLNVLPTRRPLNIEENFSLMPNTQSNSKKEVAFSRTLVERSNADSPELRRAAKIKNAIDGQVQLRRPVLPEQNVQLKSILHSSSKAAAMNTEYPRSFLEKTNVDSPDLRRLKVQNTLDAPLILRRPAPGYTDQTPSPMKSTFQLNSNVKAKDIDYSRAFMDKKYDAVDLRRITKVKQRLDEAQGQQHLSSFRRPVNEDHNSSMLSSTLQNPKKKGVEFPRAFIDKNKVDTARLQRINENRAMVQLEPIGGTDVMRSVLASDIPPNSYFTRSLAKAGKEVSAVKQIQAQMSLRSQRQAAPTNSELQVPNPKKMEMNYAPIKYPNQSASETSPVPNKFNLTEIPRRRSNVGNAQTKATAAEMSPYYNPSRALFNESMVPFKSEIAALPKLANTRKTNRSWVDQGVRADANVIRNELMVGKVPVSKKKEYPAQAAQPYDDEPEPYLYDPYSFGSRTKKADESSVKNQYIPPVRPNNLRDARRRRRDLMNAKPTGIPAPNFNAQNHDEDSVGKIVDIKALLAEQQEQRRQLLDGRSAALQQNTYRSSRVNMSRFNQFTF